VAVVAAPRRRISPIALRNTLIGLAVILNSRTKALAFYRTLFFLPILVPDVALSIVWLQMFNPQYGLVNALIEGADALVGLDLG
jgi:multiple sugar transport system permease protein